MMVKKKKGKKNHLHISKMCGLVIYSVPGTNCRSLDPDFKIQIKLRGGKGVKNFCKFT